MKKIFLSSILLTTLLLIFSCSKDDNNVIPVEPDPVNTTLSGKITSDMTLTNDVIWQLQGRVAVTNGATLTIDKGTIIKALPGSGPNASTLIVARGAKIMANGTADEPIVMTSVADNINVGQKFGTNLGVNDRALWGGLLILGKAKISVSGNASESQIEGIPASDSDGLYGGSDDADNSGVLNYVSIRHGGTAIGEGNEINGLTLGGVGSGTSISNIEIIGNLDDGVEFFGGDVNVSNLLTWGHGDDGLDVDQAFGGTVSNSVVIEGEISDHAMEIDGGEGSFQRGFVFDKITLIGNTVTEGGEYADLRDKPEGTFKNIYATGFKTVSDLELDNNAVAQNFLDGKIVFQNWVINLPAGVPSANSIFVEKTGEGENPIILNPNFTERAATWSTAGTSGGADLSVFSWTFAKSKGAL
ncbi:MAG: hypothetical protein JJE55_01145 [Flavobacteriaceae bacterium]|nr:hypothetical protein [Flavobacteriaceae bacterium]